MLPDYTSTKHLPFRECCGGEEGRGMVRGGGEGSGEEVKGEGTREKVRGGGGGSGEGVHSHQQVREVIEQ